MDKKFDFNGLVDHIAKFFQDMIALLQKIIADFGLEETTAA